MTVESITSESSTAMTTPDDETAAPDINDVEPFSEADIPCLTEIRSVMEKHGTLGRFAIQLRHQHFELGENEALLETVEGRTLTSETVSLDEVVLEEGEGLMVTSIDLLEAPTKELLEQQAGRPLCRYIFVDTPHGSEHQHMPIYN
ncbi:MAG TPA: hypothetical protein VF572_00330 [Candidatus Saccharimonadales bacterium]|jgi:hypothetical protein